MSNYDNMVTAPKYVEREESAVEQKYCTYCGKDVVEFVDLTDEYGVHPNCCPHCEAEQ